MTVAYVNIESAAQGTEDDKLAELLRETAMHHDGFEKATPFHNWWNQWPSRRASRRRAPIGNAVTRSCRRPHLPAGR